MIQVPVIVKNTKAIIDGAKAAETSLQTAMVPKRVRLLKFLKWKCGEVVKFRKINGVELAFQKTSLPEEYKALTTGITPVVD